MAKLIGIAGDSGTGKTTIAKIIAKKTNATVISLDDYHKYGREKRKEMKISPLNSKASDFKWFYENLVDLKLGKAIEKPIYNHKTGEAMFKIEKIRPKKYVIIEGLLPFYTKKLRDKYDLRIFVQPETELQIEWKLKRDSQERNYAKQFDLIERKGDFKKYVLPQKKNADIILSQRYSHFSKKIVACQLIMNKCPKISITVREGKYSFGLSQDKKTAIYLDGDLSPLFKIKPPIEVACSLILKVIRHI